MLNAAVNLDNLAFHLKSVSKYTRLEPWHSLLTLKVWNAVGNPPSNLVPISYGVCALTLLLDQTGSVALTPNDSYAIFL